ncbi:MAG: hypothetical protein E6G51_08250 [Actinobacteria bacterium]|nr:MAG: hypothetical protein E6G51_08250 [Actinomycetota bacterium]
MGSPETEPSVTEVAATGVPDDADDLRGYHFSRLMRTPLTLVLIAALTAVVFVACLIFIGALVGAGGAIVTLLLGVVIVFVIADQRAANDFFEVYAEQRGLTLIHERGRLPQATPLLRKGDDRYTERTMTGRLADSVHGTLALFTYEEETTNSEGQSETNYYRYTVGFTQVDECAERVPELYCQRKFGLRALEKFEDVFRTKKERVKLESEVLDRKYEIFAGTEQDAVWLRRLFSPTFIVWLTDSAPDKFAFELVDGNLCCYVNGHQDDAEGLDSVAVATGAVATRLREEALE